MEYGEGQFSKNHLEQSIGGIKLFNDQYYWECHEFFEDLWKEDCGDNARYVWWAIIQVAAAMIHYRNENILGAQGLIGKAKKKFNKIKELGVETNILYEFFDWEELKIIVFKIPEDSKLEHFKNLYNFRFKYYLEV